MFIYIIFFLFSLGQIGRISLFNNNINFYLYELFLLAFFITLFVKNKFKPLIKNKNIFKWSYLFIIWLVITYLISLFDNLNNWSIVPILYLLRTGFYFVFIIYSYKLFNDKTQHQIKKGILFFIFLTGLFSIMQYFLYGDLRNLLYLGWDPHAHRMFGVFLDTSISSAIYGLVLLYLFLNYKKINLNIYFKNSLLIIYSVFGLLTYSRIFYISIFLTFVSYLLNKKQYILIVIFSLILLSGILSLPKFQGESTNLIRIYSINSRLNDYKEGTMLFKKSPIWGYGYNRLVFIRNKNKNLFGYPDHAKSSFQSSFLTILVTSGIIGIILYILSLLSFSKINNAAKYYILFLSAFSLMDNILLHPFILFLFLFFVSDS